MRGIWCRKQSNWSASIRLLDMCSFPFAFTILRLVSPLSPQARDLQIEREHRPSTNSGGFSLTEVMVSVAVLSVATLGITSVWKLADDKALAARLDERATRILAEYSELQNFAPAYLVGEASSSSRIDFETQGLPLSPGETRTGFMYHPRHVDPAGGKGGNVTFDDAIPYQLTLVMDGQVQLITLTYQLPYLSDPKATVVKQIRLYQRQ
jgi:prepilin-type N-terminal cleavage/methylation domain-containing protein